MAMAALFYGLVCRDWRAELMLEPQLVSARMLHSLSTLERRHE
jgi:hypothetical protein